MTQGRLFDNTTWNVTLSFAIFRFNTHRISLIFVLRKKMLRHRYDITCIHGQQPVVAEKFAGIVLVFP